MYCRACLSRTTTLVVALSLTAASAHALAREFQKQTEGSGVKTVTDSDRKPLGAAMVSVQADPERDPTAAALVERKVE